MLERTFFDALEAGGSGHSLGHPGFERDGHLDSYRVEVLLLEIQVGSCVF